MRVKITFKDPDAVGEHVRNSNPTSGQEDLTPEERDELNESRIEHTKDKLRKWITYGEYVTIVFDTDMMTAEVCSAQV
jgi:hypothetical protein